MPGELTEDDLPMLKPVVSSAAHGLARKYRQFAEASDIAQDLYEWMWKHQKTVLSFIDRQDEKELKQGLKGLQKTLYREGDKICRKIKANVTGYRVSDEFFYTKTLLENLIVARANSGKMDDHMVMDNVKRSKSMAEGGDLAAMLMDLEEAMEVLEPGALHLLERAVVDGESHADLAAEFDVSRQAIESRLGRIYDKLIDALGGDSPYR